MLYIYRPSFCFLLIWVFLFVVKWPLFIEGLFYFKK